MHWGDEELFCRLCLQGDDVLEKIFGASESHKQLISTLIEEHLRLKISEMDGLPQNICGSCLQKLQDFAEFRAICFRSQVYLDKVLLIRKAMEQEDVKEEIPETKEEKKPEVKEMGEATKDADEEAKEKEDEEEKEMTSVYDGGVVEEDGHWSDGSSVVITDAEESSDVEFVAHVVSTWPRPSCARPTAAIVRKREPRSPTPPRKRSTKECTIEPRGEGMVKVEVKQEATACVVKEEYWNCSLASSSPQREEYETKQMHQGDTTFFPGDEDDDWLPPIKMEEVEVSGDEMSEEAASTLHVVFEKVPLIKVEINSDLEESLDEGDPRLRLVEVDGEETKVALGHRRLGKKKRPLTLGSINAPISKLATCGICDRSFSSNRGLAIHLVKMHYCVAVNEEGGTSEGREESRGSDRGRRSRRHVGDLVAATCSDAKPKVGDRRRIARSKRNGHR